MSRRTVESCNPVVAKGRDHVDPVPVWHGYDDVPAGFGPCVVTIGVFDGVHRGHAVVIGKAVERARAAGVPTVVMTFHPHPRAVMQPEQAKPLLSLPEHRAPLVGAVGADALLVYEYTKATSDVAPEDFIRELVERLHPVAVAVGHDFVFGKTKDANVEMLASLGERYGFETEVVTPQGEDGVRFSSSRAREALFEGDVDAAAEVLGRQFAVSGTVIQGAHRGRELGFPTANLACPPELVVPADGVYAGWLVRHDGTRLPAAISVGTIPQFHGHERLVEAYVLDRDDLELYGERVRVEFVAHIRGQQVFDSVDSLVEQMKVDVDTIRDLLAP